MKKSLSWLRKYWYIPFFVIAVLLGWALFRRREITPMEQIKQQLEVIDAASTIRKIEKERGAEKAREIVEITFKKEMNELDKAQKKKAEELRNDPVKLAKFLVRVSGP